MPVDTNFDDPVFEPIYTTIIVISFLVTVLPVSIAVLKIKHRSMWWVLLCFNYSPLWLSDSKQKCKASYIYLVSLLDAIFLTDGIAYFFENIQTNPGELIAIYGFFFGIMSMILASIANFGFNDLAFEDLTIHDAEGPEVKEPRKEIPHSELERDETLQPLSQVLKPDDNN